MENNQPAPQLPDPVPQPEPPHHKPLKILLVVLGLLSVSAIILFIYMFIQAYVDYEIPIIQPSQQFSSPTPDETASQVSDGTWKTYRNEEYGFDLQYPSKLSDYILENANHFTITYPGPSDIPLISVNYYQTMLTPQEWWEENGATLYSWLFNTAFNQIEISGSQGELTGLKGIEVVGQRKSPGGSTLSSSIILLPHSNNLFIVYGFDSEEDYKNILSTFRFLEEESTTDNVPPIPGANLLIRVVDEFGQEVREGTIEVLVEYRDFPDRNYRYAIDLASIQDGLLALYPPPSHIPATVSLRVVTLDGRTSDTLEIRNKEYWDAVERSTIDYVAIHTFDLNKKDQMSEINY